MEIDIIEITIVAMASITYTPIIWITLSNFDIHH